MSIVYLKKASREGREERADLAQTVQRLLGEIESGGESVTRRLAAELDRWQGDIEVGAEQIAVAVRTVPQRLKDDIRYAHDNIRRFAEAQRASLGEFSLQLRPGLLAGQRVIPVVSAGCYVPGGRYSHIASALMTVTTAKVAGVSHISACSPPRLGRDGEGGIPPAILFTLELCGADRVLALGGVQAIAAMAFGQFGLPAADILVGPGNAFVAEAKRQLFGRVGIDMFAGPTDSMVLADDSAVAELVARDLVGQAEHGADSPVWLVSSCRKLAEGVMALVPHLIAQLPQPNRDSADVAWRELAEVMICDSREEMASIADRTAPEHLHVQAREPDWWRQRLRAYGSLFLGAETTVAFGDKAAGPNHVLPTSGAARYTGGLSVHKFLKTVTWQQVEASALAPLAEATARISRHEGMEGHALSADVRLRHLLGQHNPPTRIEEDS